MKFFIYSETGKASRLAFKLMQEGHDVEIHIPNKRNLAGIVPHINSVADGLRGKPDVVVIDGVGSGIAKADEALRASGIRVVGGNDWANQLAYDDRFALKAMDTFGIRCPKVYSFDNVGDAIDFVHDQNQYYGFRMESTSIYDFIPKSYGEQFDHMKYVKGLDVKGRVFLDEIIFGHDIAVEVWYSKGMPVPMPVVKLETNKFMTGDAGMRADGQTSLAFAYPKRQPKIVQESLKKINPFLERVQYTGPLCIHGTVKKNKFYGRYFSTSPASTASFLRLLDEPLGTFLHRIGGGDASRIALMTGFTYSVKVTLPPYPTKNAQATSNVFVEGLDSADLRKMFPQELYMDGLKKIFTCGAEVMDLTGSHTTAFDAEREAVSLFRNLRMPMKQARLGDGAKIAMRRMEDLAKNGYEMPPFREPSALDFGNPVVGVEAVANVG